MDADTACHVSDRAPVIDHEFYRRRPILRSKAPPCRSHTWFLPSSGTRRNHPRLHQTGNGPSLHGIDTQIAKAEKAVAGQVPIKRNRFITLSGGSRAVNRDLETKVRALAGWKPYVTNLDQPARFVIGAYHQLWHVEHSFRMSKHDLKARPIFHRKRESIDAHLAVVFAALAVSQRIEHLTGWTISRFVKTLRRYRTVQINTGNHQLTAEQPIPDDARNAIDQIHGRPGD